MNEKKVRLEKSVGIINLILKQSADFCFLF